MLNKSDYYKTLCLPRTATQEQIKQSYKALALKYHPDKNDDKTKAKARFTAISEAYTVLHNPEKRAMYDKYGVVESQMDQFQNFEEFMSDFSVFQQFLEAFMEFDEMQQMDKLFSQKAKGLKKGKNSKRAKGGMHIDHLFKEMFKDMEKELKKFQDEEDSEEEDIEDLTEQQMLILEFGTLHTDKKKKKKKTVIICKLDQKEIEEEEILLHFSQHHLQEFKKWIKEKGNNHVISD